MICLYVVGFLLFGCMNTLTTKIMFTTDAEGIDGEVKAFQKPWFAVWAMFVGMAINLIAHIVNTSRQKQESLPDDGAPKPQLSPVKTFLAVGIPAMFDLTTTGLSSIGLLYLPASIWQMLRGANIIFSASLSVLFLGRKMRGYNWLGIGTVVFGVSLVGFSNFLTARNTVDLSSGGTLFGMGMTVLAQFFSGGQVVTEEKLLKGLNVPRLQLVGYEGIWGAGMMMLLFIPMYYISGKDAGSYENCLDSFTMIENGSRLQHAVILYTLSCACYNLCAVCVTGALSAVHRTMFMALRTLIVWVVDLSVFYMVDPNIAWGESWSVYSYVELVGFLFLVTGQAVYAGVLQVPGMKYAPSPHVSPVKQNFVSPGAMKLNSPGLPESDSDDDGDTREYNLLEAEAPTNGKLTNGK